MHATARYLAACAAVVAALTAVLTTGGCDAISTARAERAEQAEARALADAGLEARRDVRVPGLEIQIWAVTDSLGEVGRTLASVAEEERSASANAWRDAGLRVVSIPVERVDETRASLRLAAPVHQRRMRGDAVWGEFVGGVEVNNARARIGERIIDVGTGRGRLLGRAWFEPSVGEDDIGVALRVELVPQLVVRQDRNPLEELLAGEDRAAQVGDALGAGRVWRSLALKLRADGSRAWVIVPEPPEADWSALPETKAPDASDAPVAVGGEPAGSSPAPAGPAGPIAVSPDPIRLVGQTPSGSSPAGGQAGPAGPVAARLATLGEVLLSVDVPVARDSGGPSDDASTVRRVELIVVLVPTVPEGGVSLLGGSR